MIGTEMSANVSPKHGLSRRSLLRKAFYLSTATAVAPLLSACGGTSSSTVAGKSASGATELFIPRGPLANIGALSLDPQTQIRIPEGFSVRAVATSGLPVATPAGSSLNTFGFNWHTLPDGGATYALADGGWIYTSNSEVLGVGGGGCSAIKFNADGEVVDAYPILTATTQNCAGGKTPWQTWVSCEETTAGVCWECNPFAESQGIAKPSLGLFAHEAVAVDQAKGIIYLTEDNGSGRFYRWVADPNDIDLNTGRMAMETGTLQVMNVAGFENGGYPSNAEMVRELRGVTWVDVIRPSEPQSTVRSELSAAEQAVPGTLFNGGEGLWYYSLPADVSHIPRDGSVATRGIVFFTCKGDNRVWALDVENQLAELIFDNEQIEPDFNDVDNLTISPWGDVIVAEDPPTEPYSRIMVVLPNATSVVLVQCEHPGSEICGPAFSPDGRKLYFSSQRRGGGETYELTIPESILSS
ncbi:MAG: hypothetical protein ACI9BO_001989 [Zhongshania sp.]|jgi:hypothetical protein